jgi:NADH pyrophosphatase NudC (nudix superfamily)
VTPAGKVWECTSMDGRYQLHWWLAEPIGGRLRPSPREVSDARWLTRQEILSIEKLFDADRHFFAEILPGIA